MKRLFRFVVLFVLLLVIGGFLFVRYVDGAARSAVEEAASDSLGVKTTLAEMKIGILASDCTMGGLEVRNPSGFAGDHFLRLRRGRVAVNLSTLLKDTVEIPELTFDGIDVNVELAGDRGNYDVILENMKRRDDASSERKYIVRDLRIREINVSATMAPLAAITGSDKLARVTIPEIHLKDIGSDSEGGVVLSQLGDVIVQAILGAVSRNGAGVLPQRILEDLRGGLLGIPGFADIEVDVIGDVQKLLGGALGGAPESIGDLFKK